MLTRAYWYTILSALASSIAYIGGWWALALCGGLAPLFYGVIKKVAFSFWHGWWWATIMFCSTRWWMITYITEHGYGHGIYVAAIFIYIYWCLQAGMWFWLTRIVAESVRQGRALCVWGLSLWLYYIWLAKGVWFIFGKMQGDIVAFPLICLTDFPRSLWLLPYLTMYGLLAIMVLMNIAIALFCKKPGWSGLLVIGAMAPFLSGYLWSEDRTNAPAWLSKIAYVIPGEMGQSCHPLDRGQELAEKIMTCLERYPYANLVVLPESSYPWALNVRPVIVSILQQALIPGSIVCLGAHKKRGSETYNAIFILSNQGIIADYVKKNLVPVAEEIPAWAEYIPCIKGLFFKKQVGFRAAHTLRTALPFAEQCLLPLICSELFMGDHMQPVPVGTTYIAFLHDKLVAGWGGDMLQGLMKKGAIFKAMACRAPLIYVGDKGAWYVDSNGYATPLNG